MSEIGRTFGRRLFIMLNLASAALLLGHRAFKDAMLHPDELSISPKSVGMFRIYSVTSEMPKFDPKRWRLEVTGLVETPLFLGYPELLALKAIKQVSDFRCVTGWKVTNVLWEGVSVKTLLEKCGALKTARFVNFYSADGEYMDSLTLEQALAEDTLLAYRLKSLPLSREQGAPLRLVVPKMYGYKGVKWVNKIELTDALTLGYWEERGYSANAYLR